MPDFTKLPKWARDAISAKDREIEDLTHRNAALRGTAIAYEVVGHVQTNGYSDEPIPLGKYFRVEAGHLTISYRAGDLSISADRGYPIVLPEVSNVLKIRHLPG